MKGDQKDIKNLSNSSNIVNHVTAHKHSFNFNETETLTYRSNWTRRIIKESLCTNQILGQSLNDVKFKFNVFG